jgi:3-methyladenine DNA glycosylase/8-oxoguanine DNA glycosylase
MKQTLKIAVTVLAVAAVTMSGIALAQSDEDGATDAEVNPAVEAIVERLAPLVEDGIIDREQAEAVAEALADGFGPGRGMRRGGMHGLATAAEFLGMEAADLAAQLRDGATLAEIAGDQTDELIAAMQAEAAEHLAEAVAEGRFTEEEADEKRADVFERITTFVNEGPPEDGLRPGPGRRGRHGGGRFGPAEAGETA